MQWYIIFNQFIDCNSYIALCLSLTSMHSHIFFH